VAPQAPNGIWYPQNFMVEDKLNEPYLSISVENVKNLIDETAKYISKDQIYLMGFSQGACLTLETSARFATKYGGIIAFIGGLIGQKIDETKVFISNSDRDPFVPLVRSEETKEIMEKHGANVTLKVYKGMSHTINEDAIEWVKQNILPA
jgi:phospholipase/carboxylesterase